MPLSSLGGCSYKPLRLDLYFLGGQIDHAPADMFELFERLNEQGKTVVYVTHDPELAARAHRIVSIRDGVVVAA